MFAGGSIKLARVFGVRIGVDPSWFIVLFLIIWGLSENYKALVPDHDTQAFLLATASALLFFLSVVLHELGHALVALRNGIGIFGIDLWLFGGLAKMKRDSDSAGVEFRVAAAGPLVTAGILALSLGVGGLIVGFEEFLRAGLGLGAEPARGVAGASPAVTVLGFLALVNALVLVFNLIPGLPLDGGRIARAIIWWRTGDRVLATRLTARLGRGFGYALIAFGVYLFTVQGALLGGIWFVLIGYFLARAARGAEHQTALTSRIEGLRVEDVMDADPVAIPTQARLDRALEEFFLRYRWPWFPVIDGAGRFRGLLSRDRLEEVPEPARGDRTVDEVMSTDTGEAFRVRVEEPLEAVLGSEGLQRIGAIMAVDADGVLRGVVTLDRVRRALRPTTAA